MNSGNSDEDQVPEIVIENDGMEYVNEWIVHTEEKSNQTWISRTRYTKREASQEPFQTVRAESMLVSNGVGEEVNRCLTSVFEKLKRREQRDTRRTPGGEPRKDVEKDLKNLRKPNRQAQRLLLQDLPETLEELGPVVKNEGFPI